MSELVRTVISLGLVDMNQVREFQRWSLVDRELVLDRVEEDLDIVRERLCLVLDMEAAQPKETDLEAIKLFMNGMRSGRMFVHMDGVDVKEPVDVTYNVNSWGEYVLPWNGPFGQEEVLTNGKTYLEAEDKKVYMVDSRPVYFDDLQSLVVCKPGFTEVRDV